MREIRQIPLPLNWSQRDVDSEMGVEVVTEFERELDEVDDEHVVETELDEIDETDDESVVETDTECPQAEEPGVDEAEVAKPIILEEVEDREEMPSAY